MIRLLISLVVLPVALFSQENDLDKRFKELLRDERLSGIDLSASFINVEGLDIFHFHENERKIPASTLKPVPAGYLWLEKGPDYRWETLVHIRGNIDENGVLNGDVVIQPSGDPSLASRHVSTSSLPEILSGIHGSLRDMGITCIDGRFVMDISGFRDNPVPGSWPREDVGNYYGAGYFPLNILDNTYDICFANRKRIGDKPVLHHTDPYLKNAKWKVEILTAESGSGDQAYIFGGPETDHKTIYGTIPAGQGEFCIKGAIPNPPSFFLDTLASYCQAQGLQHKGTGLVSHVVYKETKVCWKHNSPPLKELVAQCLRKSLNGYADAFLFELRGQNTKNWKEATDLLALKIDQTTEGANTILFDGSGMSPANGITTNKMANTLSSFYNKMRAPEEFVQLFTQDVKDNSVYLKSGSLAGVIGYSGYILKKGDAPVCFSILANQVHPDQKQLVRQRLLEFIRSVANL